MSKFYLLPLFYCIFSIGVDAQDISYTVDLTEPHKNTYHVTLELAYKTAPDSIVLNMATWTPGSYLIREFAKHVNVYSASTLNGESLKTHKHDKNTWIVQNQGNKKVRFEYFVYAHELSVRNTYLDSDLGLVNGASLFIYPENTLNQKAKIKYILPKSWRISTTLPTKNAKNHEFESQNYDQLFDCPVFLGTHKEIEFEAAGVQHRIAINGPTFYDSEMLKTDIGKIVEEQTKIFNNNPNEEYLFIVITRKRGGGGLEHMNSSTLILDRFNMAQESGYKRFLGLVAHEYFHLWNVKRLRPIQLGPFDYEKENYTDLLWVMEGFTTYYSGKTLIRTAVSNGNSFINRIGNSWEREYKKPGGTVQSIAESSMDAWIKYYRSNENDYNTTISYYGRGFLMAALLEMKIIKDTNGEKSLDDLMKRLYDLYYKEKSRGFTMNEFIMTINNLTGKDYTDFFEKYIKDTQLPPLDSILSPFGYEVKFEETSNSEWGFRVRNNDEHYIINRIISGTPAHEAGLNVDDEIIAIDSFAFDLKKTSFFSEYYPDGYNVNFLIIRNELLKSIQVEVPEDKKKDLEINSNNQLKEEEEIFREKLLFNN